MLILGLQHARHGQIGGSFCCGCSWVLVVFAGLVALQHSNFTIISVVAQVFYEAYICFD